MTNWTTISFICQRLCYRQIKFGSNGLIATDAAALGARRAELSASWQNTRRILLGVFSLQDSGTWAVKNRGLNLASQPSLALFHRSHFDW